MIVIRRWKRLMGYNGKRISSLPSRQRLLETLWLINLHRHSLQITDQGWTTNYSLEISKKIGAYRGPQWIVYCKNPKIRRRKTAWCCLPMAEFWLHSGAISKKICKVDGKFEVDLQKNKTGRVFCRIQN